MKPEFPKIYAKTSTIIAAPLVLITLIFYNIRAINLPASDFYQMAVTVFGVTAALSGVCFTMAPTSKVEPTIRYAGEKFLHSSLLLIQTLIIIYAKEALISNSIFSLNIVTKNIISVIISVILSLISSMAALTWFGGFDALNNELWKNYEKRIELIREEKSREKEKEIKKSKDNKEVKQ